MPVRTAFWTRPIDLRLREFRGGSAAEKSKRRFLARLPLPTPKTLEGGGKMRRRGLGGAGRLGRQLEFRGLGQRRGLPFLELGHHVFGKALDVALGLVERHPGV